ncbi:MAG: cytochrome c biogenesis protein CcdA, partial [Pygmaiobacter sp.]
MVFAIGWTPCVGAFLGSALLLASQQSSVLKGVLLLLTYSMGLGVPFLISALLIEQLKTTFDAIKKHYRVINLVCGLLLIAVGILMMTGTMGALLATLSI